MEETPIPEEEAPETPEETVVSQEDSVSGEAPASDDSVELQDEDAADDSGDESEEPKTVRAPLVDRTDFILNAVIAVLVVAVLTVGGLLGYDMWSVSEAEKIATPAARAIEGLKDLVRDNPGSSAARVRLGEAMATAGLTKQAIEQLEAALTLDPNHTGAYLDLGIIAIDQSELLSAEGYFLKVVELTEGSEFEDVNQRREIALFYLGEIALDDSRYEDAITYFKAALRIRRDASDTYYLLAQAYRGLDQYDAALDELEIALLFDPNYPEAHFLNGEILMAQGDDINAAIHFKWAADLVPDADPPAEALAAIGPSEQWIASGSAALSNGDTDTALHDAIMATVLDPESVDALKFHGTVLEEIGDDSAALETWQKAAELAPDDSEVLDAIDRLGGV